MSVAYLIRHGQAGPRSDYDRLSDLGRKQAASLGRHLASRPIRLAISGSLRRQRETAEYALSAFEVRPDFIVDPRWDEFDLDAVYREIGPRLAEIDSNFRLLYREMMQSWNHEDSQYQRSHSPADAMVVTAWIQGNIPCGIETWLEFNDRVRQALDSLVDRVSEGPVAVFTSATPKAIAISHVTGAPQHETFRLLGSLYNTGISRLHRRAATWELAGQNEVPHLEENFLTHR
jgi:broad specificity phosphatase PhoE